MEFTHVVIFLTLFTGTWRIQRTTSEIPLYSGISGQGFRDFNKPGSGNLLFFRSISKLLFMFDSNSTSYQSILVTNQSFSNAVQVELF